MATLYVTEQGARIEKEYRRLLITKDDDALLAVQLGRVSEVVLVGQVGATTPALLMLLDAGIPLSFVTRSGRLRGRLAPPSPKNLPLRHAQYDRARDPDFCLAIGKAIVDGKLRNSRALAYRIRRSRPQIAADLLERIEQAVAATAQAADMDTLRGIEGSAAKAYFEVFRQALRPEMTFEKRTRRPPRDPANALLSLGYTLLTQNLITACEVVGLDPYDGFFHADKYGRPALALDLVEEFRGPVVDSVVQLVINKRVVGPDDFETRPATGGPRPATEDPRLATEGGTYLSDRGLRKFLEQYTHRLNTEIVHPYYDRRLTYQRVFEVQARLLAKTIQGELDKYRPFRVR